MTSDANGWPDASKPGTPLNPERVGAHALRDKSGKTCILLWQYPWWISGWGHISRKPCEAAHAFDYIGPLYTPAEAQHRERAAAAAAWIAAREAARSEAANPTIMNGAVQWRAGQDYAADQIKARIAALPPPSRHAHSVAENGAKPDTWTPERQALLRRLFPSTMPIEQILQEVNILPGPAVASMGAVETHARKIGLSRKQPPRLDGAIPPPKGTEPPPMTSEDKAEAREMLRKGKLKGARDLQEFFGCTHAEALAIVDAFRAGQRSAA